MSNIRQYTTLKGVPLRGGMITARDATQLENGSFSMVKNLRPTRPGFVKRPGQRKLHSTADGTNKVLSLYQFVKHRITERAFFAQMSDGDILKATSTILDNPSTVTDTVFGDEVFDGSSNQRPATWATVDDILVMSNGVDQHKLYVGTANYVKKFVVYSSDDTARAIPVKGVDYTDRVTGVPGAQVCSLAGIGADADNALYICTPVPANRITFTLSAANTTASVTATLKYRKNDNTWASAGATDGTASGGTTFAQSGSFTWSYPTTEIPWFMYGTSGYWYMITFSGGDMATVAASAVTYGTDGIGSGTRTSFVDLTNVWDGIMVDAIEVRVAKDLDSGDYSQYYTFGSTAVTLGDLEFDENDAIFFSSFDPITGVYIDVGDTPNTDSTSAAAISSLSYWDGNSWQNFSNVIDYTVAEGKAITLAQSGWILFPRNTNDKPQMFGSTEYYAHWYKLVLDDAISTDVVVGIYTMPWFDVAEMGKGVACVAWANRVGLASTRWPQYIYMGKLNTPNVLNGEDYSVLEAGDGRANQVLAMERFHNEMIAWQEEKGVEGGCTTLFEGYSPSTYGKLLLSSKVGILNSKCHVQVDGVLTSTTTDETLKTLVFWLSRYGGCVTDGRTVSIFTDSIQNYFDPTKPECIRYGYEDQHWMAYDSVYNLIRIGLVSGSTATVPNKFFCFDLVDKCWYEDDLGQPLSCVTEVEATAGSVQTLQVGGGTADGTVYQLNKGTNDVSTEVISYLDVEFQAGGIYMILYKYLIRCKVQSSGNINLSVYANKVLQFTESFSMTAEDTGDVIRRHQRTTNVINQAFTIRLANASGASYMSLYELGVGIGLWPYR